MGKDHPVCSIDGQGHFRARRLMGKKDVRLADNGLAESDFLQHLTQLGESDFGINRDGNPIFQLRFPPWSVDGWPYLSHPWVDQGIARFHGFSPGSSDAACRQSPCVTMYL